ncbi:hypothetical protein TH9_22655 [Thalassospira xiamenensis]|nr:hypothetical protein TH9_22655 [Thalassospira xiamenensis]
MDGQAVQKIFFIDVTLFISMSCNFFHVIIVVFFINFGAFLWRVMMWFMCFCESRLLPMYGADRYRRSLVIQKATAYAVAFCSFEI